VRTTRIHPRETIELVVLGLLTAMLVVAAASRRDFIGDGVRHLPAALSGPLHFGEARWAMFPPLLFALLRPLVAVGLIDGVESAIQPVLWLSVGCGVVFLVSVDKWLRAECEDPARRAAALLLAGSCASFVALFSDIAEVQVAVAEAIGAPVVELHAGKYVELVFAGDKAGAAAELKRLQEAAEYGASKGIEIHAGHGLTYDTVRPVAAIPQVRELNIGHFIMGEALFVGLEAAVKRMRQEIDVARGQT
jgi:hypothetical protein